jgi:dihydrofolate reductase
MRKIIASEMVSLDGFFAGPEGEIDWFVWNDELREYSLGLLGTVDTLLFGRLTYQLMAGYWPDATEEDPAIKRGMNTLQKIVFSKSLKTADWNNSRLVREIVPDEILKMKQQPGKDMVIYGSGSIVSAFTRLGLIDEYRIIVNPVILGRGKPLFREIGDRLKLKLVRSTTFGSGVVVLTYHPATGM